MKKSLAVAALLVIMIALLTVSIFVAFNGSKPANSPTVQYYGYSVINTYPHDPTAFTEGLVYADSYLYESTGLNGASSLRRVDLSSGKVLQEVALPNQFFGEGIAIVNESIVQLTYLSHVGFVYNKDSFSLLSNFSYLTEGWGLTYDGKHLIMSDGSDNLNFLDPLTFQRVGQVQVRDGNVTVSKLNELDYIKGDVYANIFEQQKIAVINPGTGQVKAWIDLSGLQDPSTFTGENVLNGIAYDSVGDRLFVTGKDWSQIYQIKLVPTK